MFFMVGGWGDAGTADGRNGAQQRKLMNRSLGNEPAAAPVPIRGRKEVHGNSDPDQPGKALLRKKFGEIVFMSASLLLHNFKTILQIFITLKRTKIRSKGPLSDWRMQYTL